jgi:hypothetical protein
MARIIKPHTTHTQGWMPRQIGNFVLWQRDLPPFQYWIALVCGLVFAGYGFHFLLRGIQALQQGQDWSALLATGNTRLPYVSVEREILSGSLILLICSVLLPAMIAARSGWLDRFAEN